MNIDTKLGPYMKSNDTTFKMMRRLIISLIPIVLFSVYKNGVLPYLKGYTNFFGMLYPLVFIILGCMSTLVTEEIFLIVFKKKKGNELLDSIKDGYGIIPGLFLSLVLPINTPLAILFIGGIFALLIGKMIYGGFGYNIFNPALIGAIFVITCYGTLISTNGGYINRLELDTVSSATPLTNVNLVNDISYDTLVKPYGGISSFLIGTIPGALGETSSILIILAFIYLTITKTIKWRIPTSYILTFILMVSLYSCITNMGTWYILFEVLSGGLLFGAVFMATDPVTSPVTPKGQILYGMALGLMTFLIRYLTSYPEGVMTSILFMNVFVLFFDKIGSRIEYNKKYYIFYIVMILVIIGLGTYIGIKNIPNEEVDLDYNIVDIEDNDGIKKYTVIQKGFGGDIKSLITFDSKGIKSIEILDHYESEDRYKMVMDEKLLNKIIENQNNVSNVDTVSGATISSNAIKKMVENTINAYIKDTGVTIKNNSIEIISKEYNKDAILYVIRLSSFNGKMDLQVVMKNNTIRTIIPLKYNDTCISETNKSEYYTCPEYLDQDYINKLIINQNNLDSVDTVSGATISSKALKEAVTYMKEEGLNG
nr:RnfABCDGE type electron transport complex subunit D [Bacilli bacterium]